MSIAEIIEIDTGPSPEDVAAQARALIRATDVEVVPCKQREPEWFAARMGIPTASQFGTVLREATADGDPATRTRYLRQLAGEVITGDPCQEYVNEDMRRGIDLEGEALAAYSLRREVDLVRPGFVRSAKKGAGCSPDALVVGRPWAVEIKVCWPHTLIEHLDRRDAGPPPRHIPQCQGVAWLCGLELTEIVMYCPRMPMVIRTIEASAGYHKRLQEQVDIFNFDLAKLVKRVKGYR